MKINKSTLGFSLFLLTLGVAGAIEQPRPNKANKEDNKVLLEQLNKLDEEYTYEGNQVINNNAPAVYWIEETQETVIKYSDGTISRISSLK